MVTSRDKMIEDNNEKMVFYAFICDNVLFN